MYDSIKSQSTPLSFTFSGNLFTPPDSFFCGASKALLLAPNCIVRLSAGMLLPFLVNNHLQCMKRARHADQLLFCSDNFVICAFLIR